MTSAPRGDATVDDDDRRWRLRASLAEGLANLRDGALLSALLVAFATLTIGGAVLVDVVAVGRVVAAERSYLERGGDLLVAQTARGAVDAARCDALGRATGVRAAAAVTVRPAAVGLVGRPDSQQTVVTATSGVLDLLDVPDLPADGVVVSSAVAERWQWSVGTHVQLDPVRSAELGAPSTVLTVAAVRDLGILSEGASTGILLIQPPAGGAERCFVRIEAQYRADVRATVPAALGETGDNGVNVSDRLPAGALSEDPSAAFHGRVTRGSGAAAGLLLGLVWAVVLWTRRSRAALYASIGLPYSGGVLVRWTEGAGVVVLGGLWGVTLAIGVAAVRVDVPLDVAVGVAVRGGCLATAVALTVTVLAGLWRPSTLAALKDR